MRPLLSLILLAACGGSSSHAPDASLDAAKTDAAIDSPPGSSSGTALTHTLYINTEGVTVTSGSDNAVTNTTSLVTSSVTLKPWLLGDSGRTTKIAAVINQVTATFAPYNVTVVNARPAAGPYDMVVITDSTATEAQQSAGAGGTLPFTCNQTASMISMLFAPSYASYTATQVRDTFATYAITMFAVEAGIPMSKVNQDCMCYEAAECQTFTGPCTIGGANIAVDTTITCGTTPSTMNEAAQFTAAFGPHP